MRTKRLNKQVTDLKPYIEFFHVLHTYVRQGYLEVLPASGEAYITEPALHTLSCTDDIVLSLKDANGCTVPRWSRRYAILYDRMQRDILAATRRIRTYAEFLNTADEAYKHYIEASDNADDQPASQASVSQAAENVQRSRIRKGKKNVFALHVVEPAYPHNLKYTILLLRQRKWWMFWKQLEKHNVITYPK